MRLYEYEAKQIFANNGLTIPTQLQLAPLTELQFTKPCALKAQVLFGNRKQKGLIELCRTQAEFDSAVTSLTTSLQKLELPDSTLILAEELSEYQDELYFALRYDTRYRLPVIMFTAQGGSGIEERSQESEPTLYPLTELENTRLPALHPALSSEFIKKLIEVFFAEDLTLLEINPLVVTKTGELLALDGKVELDDTATFRHEEWAQNYPPRTLFQREPTNNELRAKAVNAIDHRGVAGASYLDFDGTIGILASGGGASLLAMDALLATSLKPANYTEYSGNPTREKVKGLSEIVLSRQNLEGLWVIGGHANFTDIYETLMGVMDAVEAAQLPAGFPIVIRRGGPRTDEAFAELKKRAMSLGLHIETFDSQFPITDTVLVLEKAVQAFRTQKGR
jgi:succinyl-CoA synthetase beta subunit